MFPNAGAPAPHSLPPHTHTERRGLSVPPGRREQQETNPSMEEGMERPPLQLQGPLRSPRGGPTERSSLKSPHTTPCEGHKLLLTKRSGGGVHCDPGSLPRGAGRCGGVTRGGLATRVAPAGAGPGFRRSQVAFSPAAASTWPCCRIPPWISQRCLGSQRLRGRTVRVGE